MRRAVVGSLVAGVVLGGCVVNRFDAAEPTEPPHDWSRTAVIGESVTVGPLLVRLDSEMCTAGACFVRETVTNRSDSVATFDCSKQIAATGSGKHVDQFFVTLGSGGGGCTVEDPGAGSPWEIGPGESRSYEAHFYTEGEIGISRVLLPGGAAVDVPLIRYVPETDAG